MQSEGKRHVESELQIWGQNLDVDPAMNIGLETLNQILIWFNHYLVFLFIIRLG